MAQTIEEVQADRDAVYAARLSFLTTGAVKEVSRAGRRLVKASASLAEFDRALAALDAEIARLGCEADGTRRRRAFTLGYS